MRKCIICSVVHACFVLLNGFSYCWLEVRYVTYSKTSRSRYLMNMTNSIVTMQLGFLKRCDSLDWSDDGPKAVGYQPNGMSDTFFGNSGAHAQNNHHMFFRTRNLTRLSEYLQGFDTSQIANFAEVAWICLYSVTLQNSILNTIRVLDWSDDEPQNKPWEGARKWCLNFDTYETPAFYVAIQAVIALYSSGRTTRIVLDPGYGKMHSEPLYEGYSLQHTVMMVDVAGFWARIQLHHHGREGNGAGYKEKLALNLKMNSRLQQATLPISRKLINYRTASWLPSGTSDSMQLKPCSSHIYSARRKIESIKSCILVLVF